MFALIVSSTSLVKNLVHDALGATEYPIQQIINIANTTLQSVKKRTDNMILNLPTSNFSPYGSEKKQFLNLIFGIAGTAFGISNTIQISKLNAPMAKVNTCTDMLVDIAQLHENHLHSLDIQVNNSAKSLTDFVTSAVASQAITSMLMQVNEIQTRIEDGLDQAQST